MTTVVDGTSAPMLDIPKQFKKRRVLFIGDGLRLTTGFATVIRYVSAAFVEAGHEVHQVAGLDVPPGCRSEEYLQHGVTPWFPADDPIGTSVAREVCEKVQPDLIFLICDAGTAYSWQLLIRRWYDWDSESRPQIALYSPVEGSPITASFGASFKMADIPLTATHWGRIKLKEQYNVEVPTIYHGVDTDDFRPLASYERKLVRDALGWTGKFVVTFIGRNNGRKGHDRLIKAAQLINEQQPASNVHFYVHCKAFEQYTLEGWDLRELRELYGVENRVEFPEINRSEDGISTENLAQKLAASDLYLSPSSVEGFGLPTLEAMACGLPVIVPQDGGNQEEVAGDAAIAWLPVVDWQTWHTNADLARVSPAAIAGLVMQLSNPKMAATLQEAGEQRSLVRARLPQFNWESNAIRIYGAVMARYAEKT